MKRRPHLLWVGALLLGLTCVVSAQESTRPKRPVKNPPQFPNIIDMEGKEAPATPAGAAPSASASQPSGDALTQAVLTLVGEVRSLTREMRAMNIRQQAQIDLLKMTRVDMRIDHYERELRPIRDRMAAIDAEEQTLMQLMTRDSLFAQVANVPTFNREETMRQLRAQHETRLRSVQAEKERLRRLDTDLTQSLSIYQKLSADTEERVQKAEEQLRELESSTTTPNKDKEVKKP